MVGDQLKGALERALSGTAVDREFSGVVRVSVGDTLVFEEAHGLADRARGIPNTVDTRFGVASGTKLFTALAVGTLIDEGRVDFETRLSDIVSAPLPGIAPEVTVHHLLTHTSGVYDYYDEELIEDFDAFALTVPPSRLCRPGDYLSLITGRPMKFAPGARFSYSNSGYVLLGLVIEELTGLAYQEAVVQRVFAPAGMLDSGFFRFDRLPERVARGYVETRTGWKTNADLLPIVGGPDGGAFSTAGDIERVWTAFVDGGLLSEELTSLYSTPAAESKPGLSYGCGLWILEKGAGRRRFRIEGSDAGVSFCSMWYGNRTVATVMSNTSAGAWSMHEAIDDLANEAFFFERGRPTV